MDILTKYKELLDENTQLKEDLIFSEAMEDYWKIHSSELNEDIEQLKNEIIDLKTKLYDAHVKEQRLLKILNETSDYT